MHPQELINTILSNMWEWSIRNSAVTKIAHNDHEIRFTTADGSEHTCHFADDHPDAIQDIRPPEAAFLGAPTRPEKIWVYKEDCSKPREKVSIVLINKQAAEKNDQTMAEYRTRRDQRAQAAREARDAARKERQAAYQRDHVDPMDEILRDKTVEKIAFTDGGFSITVGGLVVQVTPDVRASRSEFEDGHAAGLCVSFGDGHPLSTHDLEEEE